MKKPARLLLIEDDPVLGPVTMDLLTLIGHQASLTPSFEDAYEVLTHPHAIELVLLDLQLGTKRGEDLIKAVRQKGMAPPVVIFSAMPIADLRTAANEIGADLILQKPCSVQQMTLAIEKVLG